MVILDADLFKEAFIKAQQENEPLFKEDADAAKTTADDGKDA